MSEESTSPEVRRSYKQSKILNELATLSREIAVNLANCESEEKDLEIYISKSHTQMAFYRKNIADKRDQMKKLAAELNELNGGNDIV